MAQHHAPATAAAAASRPHRTAARIVPPPARTRSPAARRARVDCSALAAAKAQCSLRTYVGLAQLDFTVCNLKPISEGHSFRYGGAPYKFLYGGAPYKSPKIAENRRKSELQADLRGSLILPQTTVKSSCAGLALRHAYACCLALRPDASHAEEPPSLPPVPLPVLPHLQPSHDRRPPVGGGTRGAARLVAGGAARAGGPKRHVLRRLACPEQRDEGRLRGRRRRQA